MSAYQLPPYAWPATVMGVCALAVWRGQSHERLAAGSLLAGWALSMVVYRQGDNTHWGVLLIDVLVLVLLVGLAMRSARHWPMFAAGFQLLAVVTHVARMLDATVSDWAYLTAGIIWGYLLAFAIGYGAWTAPRYGEHA